jgi:D-tyrosyl-tRNA(Tyr) deacylase
MRALLQRVTHACVSVEDQVVGKIDHGLMVLVAAGTDDTEIEAAKLAKKTANLRIFNDPQGKFNRSLLDVEGSALVVSQFTLFADARKGRRPNFIQAAAPETAMRLIEHFISQLHDQGVTNVQTGRFGAMMQVEIHNDGPVTIWLDTAD